LGTTCLKPYLKNSGTQVKVKKGNCNGIKWIRGTPTKRQVSKRQISKRPVSKRLKRQVYKTSGLQKVSCLQNVRLTKRQVFKTSGCKKSTIYIFCACGWWKSAGSLAATFAGKVMAVFYSLL
jgi:hypothetical protein